MVKLNFFSLYNKEFGNQKAKKYTPFNKFSNGNNGNAPANMQCADTFGANVNVSNNGGGAKKKRNNRRKNGNNNAANNANNSNNFQRTNSFGNNITNNHYRVKPFSTERLNKSVSFLIFNFIIRIFRNVIVGKKMDNSL